MIRFRGEKMWIGDDHIAYLRTNNQKPRPLCVQTLNGEICYEAVNRRAAELWVHVHASDSPPARRNVQSGLSDFDLY